jgi:hypothetical protein
VADLEEMSRTFDRKPICHTLADVAASIENRPLSAESAEDQLLTEQIVRQLVAANVATEAQMSDEILKVRHMM